MGMDLSPGKEISDLEPPEQRLGPDADDDEGDAGHHDRSACRLTKDGDRSTGGSR